MEMSQPQAAKRPTQKTDNTIYSLGYKTTSRNKLFHLLSPFTIILANVSIRNGPRPQETIEKKILRKAKENDFYPNGGNVASSLLVGLGCGTSKSTESHCFFQFFSITLTYILTVMFLLFLSVIRKDQWLTVIDAFFLKAGPEQTQLFPWSIPLNAAKVII